MPRQNAEHDARLVLRLPKGMLEALRWTAKHDKLPLSDWVRNHLQKHCYSLRAYSDEETEQLIDSASSYRGRTVATRPATGLAESGDNGPHRGGPFCWYSGLAWNGGRKDKTMTLRSYTDREGNKHLGSLPPTWAWDTDRQDLFMDRREARRELTTWLNRWGRQGKTLRLGGKELRLVQRLLASFDDFDKFDAPP